MARNAAARRNLISTALATLLACAVLLTLLGHARLTDWDEAIYAGISRSMLSDGWLMPHWNGQPWLEKPPLELWLTALSFRVFGVSEFAARLVSALSGVALVAILHAWLTLRRDALTAWFHTLILLSTFGFQHVARVGEMDVLLSLTCTLALIGLCELQRPKDHCRGWLLFWSGFGLALMTKGAASITLPITLLVWMMLKRIAELRFAGNNQAPSAAVRPAVVRSSLSETGALAHRSTRLCVLGFAIFLVLTVPWHLAMLHRFGSSFTAQYLGLHVLTRATQPIEGHVSRWYFYLRVLLVSAAPWVLLAPAAVYAALSPRAGRAAQRPSQGLQPFAVFGLVVVVLFSLAQTRLPHYIAPAYPALSVLTAAWLAERLAPVLSAGRPRLVLTKFAFAAAAAYGLAALVTASPRRSLHSAHLPNGDTTPDNREQVALLKQVFEHPAAAINEVSGPLLTLRSGSYNPIPATVFYSGRTVRQTTLQAGDCCRPRDKYTHDPVTLPAALADHAPHLLLADRALLAHLPPGMTFQPIRAGRTLAIGVIERKF